MPYTVRKDLVPDNLEMTCIDNTKRHSRPFLVTSWYRPPNSEQALFLDFEMFLFKSDLENKESIIMGDLNCDVSKLAPDIHTCQFQSLCSLYQLLY